MDGIQLEILLKLFALLLPHIVVYYYHDMWQLYYHERKVSAMITIRSNDYTVPTTESVIRKPDGSVIVIQRYGTDDYDAWFTDKDHMDDDTFGSSVRGSFVDIVKEIREEV